MHQGVLLIASADVISNSLHMKEWTNMNLKRYTVTMTHGESGQQSHQVWHGSWEGIVVPSIAQEGDLLS